MNKTLGAFLKTDKLYTELYSKHFTTHYKGKPTKKYLKLKKQIQKTESISFDKVERMILNQK